MPLKSASHDESYTQGSTGESTLFARRVLSLLVSNLVKVHGRVGAEKAALFCMMLA